MPQLTPEELARSRAAYAAAVEARVKIPFSVWQELPAEGQKAVEDLARQRDATARSKANPKPKSTGTRRAKPAKANDKGMATVAEAVPVRTPKVLMPTPQKPTNLPARNCEERNADFERESAKSAKRAAKPVATPETTRVLEERAAEEEAAKPLTKPPQPRRQRAPAPLPAPQQTLPVATQRQLDAIAYNAANPNPKASRGNRYRSVADSVAAERASKATYEATAKAKAAKAKWKLANPDKVREYKRKATAKSRAKKRTTPARKYHRANTRVTT